MVFVFHSFLSLCRLLVALTSLYRPVPLAAAVLLPHPPLPSDVSLNKKTCKATTICLPAGILHIILKKTTMEIILHKNQTETTSKLAQAAVETTDHLIV